MNTFPGGAQPTPQWNPQLLRAAQLVGSVRRDIQVLVPRAMQSGVVRVGELRIRRWQATLHEAIALLNRIPAILIFPPPPYVLLINRAVNQIQQVLEALDSILIASPRIYPPQPGFASISLEALRFLLDDLWQAEALLFRALREV